MSAPLAIRSSVSEEMEERGVFESSSSVVESWSVVAGAVSLSASTFVRVCSVHASVMEGNNEGHACYKYMNKYKVCQSI